MTPFLSKIAGYSSSKSELSNFSCILLLLVLVLYSISCNTALLILISTYEFLHAKLVFPDIIPLVVCCITRFRLCLFCVVLLRQICVVNCSSSDSSGSSSPDLCGSSVGLKNLLYTM